MALRDHVRRGGVVGDAIGNHCALSDRGGQVRVSTFSARHDRRSPSRERFANLCRALNECAPLRLTQFKPLDKLTKIGFVLRVSTRDCPVIIFHQKDLEPLGLAARQRGARIGPTYAVRAARVGRLRPIDKALVTASPPRRRSVWGSVYPAQTH
jgi:hypothetical protein